VNRRIFKEKVNGTRTPRNQIRIAKTELDPPSKGEEDPNKEPDITVRKNGDGKTNDLSVERN